MLRRVLGWFLKGLVYAIMNLLAFTILGIGLASFSLENLTTYAIILIPVVFIISGLVIELVNNWIKV